MSLADRVAGLTPRADKPVMCPFGRMLANMPETERVAYDQLVATVGSYAELSATLREAGYPNDRWTMVRHLKGECPCDTERSSK